MKNDSKASLAAARHAAKEALKARLKAEIKAEATLEALETKLEERYGADKVEEARNEVLYKLESDINNEVDRRLEKERDMLREDIVTYDWRAKILLKVAKTLKGKFEREFNERAEIRDDVIADLQDQVSIWDSLIFKEQEGLLKL
jgi:hypothetical protein